MTQEDIHSLHILVFILAAIHIFYSAIMVVIGPLEVRRWKAWEGPAAEKLKQQMNDPGALRLAKETTFVRRRRGLSFCKGNLFTSFLVAFFKQFYKWRVSESDYRAFRSGFIKHHCPAYPDFKFHKFIMRAFEDDCKRVVGIGWKLWTYAVVWILVDIHGWESSWLVYLVPLIIVLLIGAVMQQIITHMANNILNKNAVIEGDATIMPDDRNFGHRRPRLILKAFHYLVFQNAIGTAFPIWAAVTFSAHNCLYNTTAIVGGAIVVRLVVQLYLGLFILPVYALISQMDSGFKKSVFSKEVNLGLSRWRMRAKKVYSSKRSNDAQTNDIQVDFVPLQVME
ncbi:hypothetical protein KP509_22G034700 [Ceratopteris richardii]|nr:hypothetical protein KP509_22G034700 [Ceratopteris richardii]